MRTSFSKKSEWRSFIVMTLLRPNSGRWGNGTGSHCVS